MSSKRSLNPNSDSDDDEWVGPKQTEIATNEIPAEAPIQVQIKKRKSE